VHRFFEARGFLHTYTAPMVENPGMEVHIHPFAVHRAHGQKKTDWFLHTSPEFAMKRLLADGLEKIYQINWCFRDEPESELHRPQFLMLEWYRSGARYEDIMQDIQGLIEELSPNKITVEKKTVNEIFKQLLGFEILDYLEKEKLHHLVKTKFPHLPLFEEMPYWDDYFFLIFLNEIEPKLKSFPALILYEYPHHQAALSTIKESDSRVCERFELYLNGIEVANCFNESTDLQQLKYRFEAQSEQKLKEYQYQLPSPNQFYDTMKKYPKSAGIALGVERLYAALTQDDLF
tara:strand:- start:11033 stop:11902 length:870 start_codon:yes stop_codon:yes gene_type:complete